MGVQVCSMVGVQSNREIDCNGFELTFGTINLFSLKIRINLVGPIPVGKKNYMLSKYNISRLILIE